MKLSYQGHNNMLFHDGSKHNYLKERVGGSRKKSGMFLPEKTLKTAFRLGWTFYCLWLQFDWQTGNCFNSGLPKHRSLHKVTAPLMVDVWLHYSAIRRWAGNVWELCVAICLDDVCKALFSVVLYATFCKILTVNSAICISQS